MERLISKAEEDKLKQLYTGSPAGFSSARRLQKYAARKAGIVVSEAKLTKLMQRWALFSKFQTKYKKAKRRDRAVVAGPHHLFQIDLCILPKYRGFIGLLVWFGFGSLA